MYCSSCGQGIRDGARFCENCGNSLQAPGGVTSSDPGTGSWRRQKDPYKDQIAQLKLQLKQLKLDLKQINTRMSNTRSQYYETATFVPRGLLRHGYKMFEDLRLLGPQQQKQYLQQEVMRLEQELLNLQQAQAQWRARS